MESNNSEMIDVLPVYDAENDTALFSRNKDRYVIPLYQRAYAWTDVEIEQLIDDILDHSGDNYYIGSLIVHRRNRDCGVREFEVIDGQQRLTTLQLLMAALKKQPMKSILSFDCRKKADDTLKMIVEGKDILDEYVDRSLVEGKRIIDDKLSSVEVNVNKDDLMKKLANVQLFRIQVPPRTDLNRYFEIMNTRGAQLEQHDILKARLMSALETDAKKMLFAQIWDACSDMTGYVQRRFPVSTVSENNMLETLFTPDLDSLREDISFEEHAKQGKDGDKHVYTIEEVLGNGFQPEHDDGTADTDDNVRFESLIDFPHFLLHVLRVYIDHQNIRFPVGQKPNELLDDKELLRAFDRVEQHGTRDGEKIKMEEFSWSFMEYLLRCRFLFDKYIIKREYSDKAPSGQWSLKQLEASKSGNGRNKTPAAYFKNTFGVGAESKNHEILMLQSALRVSYTSPKTMHWITELLMWLYESDDQVSGTSYVERIEDIAITVVEATDICTEDEDGDGRRMGVKTPRIVFNYLDFLLWRENKEKYADFVFEFRNSVEHWYPQNPSKGTFERWAPHEFNDFGNLCLVQRSENSRFSNLTPRSKMDTYKQTVDKGSLKMRQMADRIRDKDDPNAAWRAAYKDFGTEMIEKLKAACHTEQSPKMESADVNQRTQNASPSDWWPGSRWVCSWSK